MDSWSPKSAASPSPSIRDTLFGDMPWALWSGKGMEGQPWDLFSKAKAAFDSGDLAAAKRLLHEILAIPELESRHYLQSWTFLREIGETPPPESAKRVLGVVIEVAMDEGADLLAAYPDHSARYINYSGKMVFWDHPDSSCDALIDALLAASQAVADRIGPWQGARPTAPSGDVIRLNFLTPSGLHFGEGPGSIIGADPMGGPVLDAGTQLMMRLLKATGA